MLEFNQSPWLKQFINFNTQKRTQAKNLFKKDFFKLMNNSACGKKTVDIKLTAKGIKKNIVKKDIKHENYKDILFNNKQVYHKMKTIQSQRHQLGSYEINKISLSCLK